MMKTLCVAVVVLSLTSVCQPASLACEKLLKPADTSPELSGTWYTIAVSSDSCFALALFDAMFLLSVEMGITSKDTPNIYDANVKVKINGLCAAESVSIFYENNTMFDVDKNNTPTGKPDVLLNSGCPDCIVVKGDDSFNIMVLLSRRKTLTAAELKEFETQTGCLGWTKTLVLNSDHDYTNCQSIADDDADFSGFTETLSQRLKVNYKEPLKCLVQDIMYNPWQWIQSLW
ncbi:uncharacterized protein [Pagrus major]|uniref:uncharacterized protein n=1 Tax=Pagrus major TaxID=143350 RepID=UPI003CC88590